MFRSNSLQKSRYSSTTDKLIQNPYVETKKREMKLYTALTITKTVATFVMTLSAFAILKTLAEMVWLKLSIDSIYLNIYHKARIVAKKRRKNKRPSRDSNISEILCEQFSCTNRRIQNKQLQNFVKPDYILSNFCIERPFHTNLLTSGNQFTP